MKVILQKFSQSVLFLVSTKSLEDKEQLFVFCFFNCFMSAFQDVKWASLHE